MRKRRRLGKLELQLHLMLIPAILLVLVYSYGPMMGLVMAFQDFIPTKGWFGSAWVGLEHFKRIFMLPNFGQVLRNTLFISFMEIVIGQVVALIITLLLNEVRVAWYRRGVQTIIYLPHFLSWVILGGILLEILGLEGGLMNRALEALGMNPVAFLSNPKVFPWTLVVSHVWKEAGFATVVLFASLSNIDITLYEAAKMDGAGRLKQMWHVTLPGMAPILALVAVLSVGSLLSAGFDQVFSLYSPIVYETGDILDTFVYRLGLVQTNYSLAAAVGMFKSVVSVVLVAGTYYLAHKFADYKIF